MNKLNELLDEFADASEEYSRSGIASWFEIRNRVRGSIVDHVAKFDIEQDEALADADQSEYATDARLVREAMSSYLATVQADAEQTERKALDRSARLNRDLNERIKETERERDELRAENAKFRNLLEESNKYFLSIDDKARSSGLTYDAVRDIVHNYLTDEEEKQISFGKMVEELRSLCRVCAEDMTKELRYELERWTSAKRMTYVTDDGSDYDRTIFKSRWAEIPEGVE
jgi:hypothetical protein